MKKIILLFALLLASVNSILSANGSEDKNILIEKGNSIDPSEIQPRSLVNVPIYCIYNGGFLYFTFLENLGEVEITVTNQSTGANATYKYDSAYGCIVVGTSSDSGTYLIGIVTGSGEYYYGQYNL